jgi:thiol-disulfide isomerase/thioredoxin
MLHTIKKSNNNSKTLISTALIFLLISVVLLTGCTEQSDNQQDVNQLGQNNEQSNTSEQQSNESSNTADDPVGLKDTGDAVDRFNEAYEAGQPIFLYFYTDTCGVCKDLDPIYSKLLTDEQYSDIAFIKVNANFKKNAEFVQKYQIRYVPSLYTYNAAGENVWNHIGPLDEDSFHEKLTEIQ